MYCGWHANEVVCTAKVYGLYTNNLIAKKHLNYGLHANKVVCIAEAKFMY